MAYLSLHDKSKNLQTTAGQIQLTAYICKAYQLKIVYTSLNEWEKKKIKTETFGDTGVEITRN